MYNFVTADGCQPVNNDLDYEYAVLRHDTRFDVCCTGPVSNSCSPGQMQHALSRNPCWCEHISVCHMEHFSLFAYFHFECKTSLRYDKAKRL